MFIADKAGFLLSIDYGFYPEEDSPIAFVNASYCIQTGRFQIPCVHVHWSRHWCDAFCIRTEVHMVGYLIICTILAGGGNTGHPAFGCLGVISDLANAIFSEHSLF